MPRLAATLILVLALCPPAPAAIASTLRALSLELLVAGSDAVVIGVAGAAATRHLPGGAIVRDVPFRVEQWVVGHGPEEIVVRLLGGEEGDRGLLVPGEVELEPGETALFFLEAGVGGFAVAGMAQGHFRVVTDGRTGVRYAERTLGELNLVGEPGPDSLGLARDRTCAFLPLDALAARIRELAAGR
ncbi:MAG: hypothetical protein PHU25_05860 [Deltaproteobacteria bacterium]|nr:hypothetical protein [Deltaproteobacteria bacterium]